MICSYGIIFGSDTRCAVDSDVAVGMYAITSDQAPLPWFNGVVDEGQSFGPIVAGFSAVSFQYTFLAHDHHNVRRNGHDGDCP